MSYDTLLINTCTIRRLIQGPTVDAYGNPNITWTDVPDQPCRITTPSGRELKIGAEVVLADYLIFLGDVVITEQDRIEIDSVNYEILLVADRQDALSSHHKECYVRTVR